METVEPKSTESQAASSVEMRRRQVVSFQTMNYRFLGISISLHDFWIGLAPFLSSFVMLV